MPSRHRIDAHTRFDADTPLPKAKTIELADVENVAVRNPPTTRVVREEYLVDSPLAEVVNLAIALGRPLLLQGDPGCGKTRLAYRVAFALGLPLEECYIKSTSRAQDLLYTYDAVNRLYDAQLGKDAPHDQQGLPRSADIRHYVHLGPLGRAIVRASYGRRSVVLIDEIDKADLDFPNDLLRELDRLEFEIPEAPGMRFSAPEDRPELRPIIFVTHNEEKALPPAFLRRCIFHFVEFPKDRRLLEAILGRHHTVAPRLRQEAISALLRLRDMPELVKKPGLSELLDWVGYLQAVKVSAADVSKLPYIGVLLKQAIDQQRAREAVGAP